MTKRNKEQDQETKREKETEEKDRETETWGEKEVFRERDSETDR